MRFYQALAAAAVLTCVSSAAFAVAPDGLAYNSTPIATYYFGNSTNYSPANSAVLSATSAAGTDQLFARWHVRVPNPNGYSLNAPASTGSVYNFALGTAGLSIDFGVTSAAGLSGVSTILTLTNLGSGQSVSLPMSMLPDNVVSGNTTENSENLSFAFLSSLGFDPNANATYRFTMTSTGLASGTKSLTVDAQVGSGVGAVPEPASWAMMITGFGLVGVAMRRRRVAVSFA